MPRDEEETMKNKVFKISLIMVMILTMTITNFISVGSTLISYAADRQVTNHKNVEFKAYFKDKEGREVTTLEKEVNQEETFLYLRIDVKKEGYFNGQIHLENSNFTLRETRSIYVNKIENNIIYLNQINVGTTEEIKVKIEPIQEENFMIGLLSMTSKVSIKGIYKDSTQKNINIQASREIKLKQVQNNNIENIINEIQVITNKIMSIDGQEKRILQFSYQIGLKQNNYPIQEIQAKITIPTIEGKQAQIQNVEYLNNMTTFDSQYDGTNLELTLRNETNQEGKAMWKKQGSENIIITCLYDADVTLQDLPVHTNQKLTLYHGKQLEVANDITILPEELDATIEGNIKNVEETIYKGKLNAKIQRPYESITQLKINLAKVVNTVEIEEETSQDIKTTYTNMYLKKEQFDKLFGQNGSILIYDQNQNEIGNITNASQVDEEGNIVIHYEGKEITKVKIQTTAPIQEGTLDIHHTKTIHSKGEAVNELKSKTTINGKAIEMLLPLQEATTKADLTINKEELSTVVANNVEIKAILASNDEKYNLYKNPELTFELPEQIEKIEINNVDILYENELQVSNYEVKGRTIHVSLTGEQTAYKEEAIQGAVIAMDTTLYMNRKASTTEEQIKMQYKNTEIGDTEKSIKIIAPTDLTPIYNLPELSVETIGQEERKQILLPRSAEQTEQQAQIEIINNNESNMENLKVLGNFPTNSANNNIGIEIIEGITLPENQTAKIYYTENEKATEEIEKAENGWTLAIENRSKVKKYLVIIDTLVAGSSIQGSYRYKIPANLEYNQSAESGYQVKYTNSNTKVENQLSSTTIETRNRNWTKSRNKTNSNCGRKRNKKSSKSRRSHSI